jgi:1-deoxy-D-xylulose-5-phosphate reductoisomerase
VFNAVNEVAVSAFLRGSIKYLEIAEIIEESLQKTRNLDPANLDDVIAADSAARSLGKELVLSFSSD